MADAEKIIADLRGLRGRINQFDLADNDVIEAAAALIERLTKPMTPEEACQIFVDLKYRNRKWLASHGVVYTDESQYDSHEHLHYTGEEAVDIARGLLARQAQKEAARA